MRRVLRDWRTRRGGACPPFPARASLASARTRACLRRRQRGRGQGTCPCVSVAAGCYARLRRPAREALSLTASCSSARSVASSAALPREALASVPPALHPSTRFYFEDHPSAAPASASWSVQRDASFDPRFAAWWRRCTISDEVSRKMLSAGAAAGATTAKEKQERADAELAKQLLMQGQPESAWSSPSQPPPLSKPVSTPDERRSLRRRKKGETTTVVALCPSALTILRLKFQPALQCPPTLECITRYCIVVELPDQ
jgi:hypothetical protein